MRIGTTSFGFRYQMLDASRAPRLESLVDQCAALGLARLQICENARPMELSDDAWSALLRHAEIAEVEIGLGCKTTDLGLFARYLARAAALPSRTLRLVFEEESGAPPSRASVDRFLERAVPLVRQAGARLAIENHFHVPSQVLADAAEQYPADVLGFCVDTANSLRNFESPDDVMRLLAPRAFCYHVKDYRVDGHTLGFTVAGAPLGEGRLDLDATLDAIFARSAEPEMYVENWTPATGDWQRDVDTDAAWLRKSAEALRLRAAARAHATA